MDEDALEHMHDGMDTVDNVHFIQEIAPGTWRIDEAGFVNCYLLAGEARALLIDTGMGFGNLRATVQSLTSLPVDVVLTHRHCDHAGGIGWFDEYAVHADDLHPVYALTASRLAARVLLIMWKKMMRKLSAQGEDVPDKVLAAIPDFAAPRMNGVRRVAIDETKTFDLGGRTVGVVSTPGHTRGSIVLLDESRGLAFSGDDANPQIWLHLPGCLTIAQWAPGCERIAVLARTHVIWAGHGAQALTQEQIEGVLACGRALMAEKPDTVLPHVRCYPRMEDPINITYNSARIH